MNPEAEARIRYAILMRMLAASKEGVTWGRLAEIADAMSSFVLQGSVDAMAELDDGGPAPS